MLFPDCFLANLSNFHSVNTWLNYKIYVQQNHKIFRADQYTATENKFVSCANAKNTKYFILFLLNFKSTHVWEDNTGKHLCEALHYKSVGHKLSMNTFMCSKELVAEQY